VITWLADCRSSFPPVVDQGHRGTCLSIAMTTAHTFQSGTSYSAEYLHWASGSRPGGRGNLTAAASVLDEEGQPPEEQWPYDAGVNDMDPAYGPPAGVAGPHATARVVPGARFDELRTHLESGHWPVLLLRVTDAFYAGTCLVLPDGPGTAGHAVVVVGVAQVTDPRPPSSLTFGEFLVCVRNSWGQDWGAEGHALISQAALSECLMAIVIIQPDDSRPSR
jgi:hypothetical protein